MGSGPRTGTAPAVWSCHSLAPRALMRPYRPDLSIGPRPLLAAAHPWAFARGRLALACRPAAGSGILPSSLLIGEEGDRRGEPMQEVAPADRTELAGGEEPGHR